MSDARRIIYLLTSLNDHLAPWTDAKTWTGSIVASSSLPGVGPSRKEPCKSCEGIGRMVGARPCYACRDDKGKHNCRECGTCQGKAELWYDDYTGQPVEASRERKASAGGKRRRSGISQRDLGDEAYKWEKAERKRNQTGSYKELERALNSLRDTDEDAHYAIKATYVEQRYTETRSTLTLQRGLTFLTDAMPKPIRLPLPLQERYDADERAERAKKLKTQGVSNRQIAKELGVRNSRMKEWL